MITLMREKNTMYERIASSRIETSLAATDSTMI